MTIHQYGFPWSVLGWWNTFLLLPLRGMMVSVWIFQPVLCIGLIIGLPICQLWRQEPKADTQDEEDATSSSSVISLRTIFFCFSMIVVATGSIALEIQAWRSRPKSFKNASVLRFDLPNLRELAMKDLELHSRAAKRDEEHGQIASIEISCILTESALNFIMREYAWQEVDEGEVLIPTRVILSEKLLVSEEFNASFEKNPKFKYASVWLDPDALLLYFEATSQPVD
ncbi:MAG: hypothetical protein AAF483_17545 [Planctomycetota bacterium]